MNRWLLRRVALLRWVVLVSLLGSVSMPTPRAATAGAAPRRPASSGTTSQASGDRIPASNSTPNARESSHHLSPHQTPQTSLLTPPHQESILTQSTPSASPSTIPLAATIRDIHEAHPDFGDNTSITGLKTNLVQSTLGTDNTPVWTGDTTGAISSAASFGQWFHDTAGVNQALPWVMTLTETPSGSGSYKYSNGSFFPIDNQGFGNEAPHTAHNYNFTLELHALFRYAGTETFTFSGDDDVWVFINKQLVVDIGGIHGTVSKSITLSSLAASLGLSVGNDYTFDFFFAERRCCSSVFQFTTTLKLQPGTSILPNDQVRTAEHCSCQNPSPHPYTYRPVDVRSGNYWTDVTDLQVETPGPSLAWSRVYASQAITETTGVIGDGWQHPYGARVLTASMTGGEGGKVVVLSARNNRLRFTDLGNGQFQAFPGIYATLTKAGDLYTYTTRDQTQYRFDASASLGSQAGRLSAMIDSSGHQLNLAYNTSSQLTDITDAQDSTRKLHLTWSNGRIATVTDGSRTISYTYTGSDLTGVQDVRGGRTTYRYKRVAGASTHLLQEIKNALWQTVESMGYDTLTPSRIITQTLEDGQALQFQYLAATSILTTTGRDGRRDVQRFTYAANNTLTGVTTNNIAQQQTTFDGSFSPATVVDANGRATGTIYTSSGVPTARTDALNHTTTAQYDARNNLTQRTDALGVSTRFRYDATNHVISQTLGIAAVDQIRATTLYTYTGDRLIEQRRPDGVVTRYVYDTAYPNRPQVISMTVGFGTALKQTTTYGYDTLGRVVTTTVGFGTPLARIDVTRYNPDNSIALSIQNYKGTGTFAPARPDENLRTSYGYDTLGRTVAVTGTLGNVTATRYLSPTGQVEWTIQNLAPLQFDQWRQPVFKPFSTTTPDRNIATRYQYDGLGRTVLVTETGILTGTFDPTPLRFSTAIERATRTEYDALSRPVTVTLNYRPGQSATADRNVQIFTAYDRVGNVVTQTDTLARRTVISYDATNRPIHRIQNYVDGNPHTGTPDTDHITRFWYNAVGQVISQTVNYDNGVFTATEPITDRITLFAYNSLGQVITTTINPDPATLSSRTDTNRVQRSAYDPITTRLNGTRDALDVWTSQRYDVLGRVNATVQNCFVSATTPGATGCITDSGPKHDRNVTTIVGYDVLNRPVDQTDALGTVTHTTYDGLGRMRSSTQNYVPAGPTTEITNVVTLQAYDALGRTTVMTDAMGSVTRTQYDALGHTSIITDATGRVLRQGYDAAGNLRWSQTPYGQIQVTQLDGLGRIATTIQNYQDGNVTATEPSDRDLITRVAYDAAGRRIRVTDATNRITRYAYDQRDLLTTVIENSTPCSLDPCNVTTTYAYDRVGNRVAMTNDQGATRTWSYDAVDQPVEARDALGQATQWRYDKGGQLVRTIDPRNDSHYDQRYTYDGRHRLTNIDPPIGINVPSVEMQYDMLGRRTQLIDSTGTTSFAYDRLSQMRKVDPPNTGPFYYEYNKRGQRSEMSYASGGSATYLYLPDGQLDQVWEGQTKLADYDYDGVGRVQQVLRFNGTQTSYTYDAANQIRQIRTVEAGTELSRYDYAVDRRGLRTVITDTLRFADSRVKTATFENNGGALTNPTTGAESVAGTVTTASPGLKGSYGARFQTNNGSLGFGVPAAKELFVSFYVRLNALPSVSTRIVRLNNRQGSGWTTIGYLSLEPDGTLRVRNSTQQVGSSSPPLSPGVTYRIGVRERMGLNNDGLLQGYLVQGDATFTNPFASSNAENLPTALVHVDVGATLGGTLNGVIDDLILDTSDFAGPSAGGSSLQRVPGLAALVAPEIDAVAVSLRSTQPLVATLQVDRPDQIAAAQPVAAQTPVVPRRPARPALQEPTPPITNTALLSDVTRLPLFFVPNRGQADPSMRFEGHGLQGAVLMTSQEVIVQVPRNTGGGRSLPATPASRGGAAGAPPPVVANLRLQLDGANTTSVVTGTERLQTHVNVVRGNQPARWQRDLPAYGGVTYQQVYPGVDVHYNGEDGKLKRTYVVAPGADPHRIRWRYGGAQQVVSGSDGSLQVIVPPTSGSSLPTTTAAPGQTQRATLPLTTTSALTTTLTEQRPIAWQDRNGRRTSVSVGYQLNADGSVQFTIGSYDATQPLILDPVLDYASYLGGSAGDVGASVTLDSEGRAYVVGITDSSDLVSTGDQPFQDAFVGRLDPATQLWDFVTYLGGNSNDAGLSIARSLDGDIYLTGNTASTDFPIVSTTGIPPLQSTRGDTTAYDAFVVQLEASDGYLRWSSYLGGNGTDEGWGIALDSFENIYVAGETFSTNFLPGLQPGPCGCSNAQSVGYVVKISAAGQSINYVRFLHPGTQGAAWALDVYETGDVAVVGPVLNGLTNDGYVTRLDSNGAVLWDRTLHTTGDTVAWYTTFDIYGGVYVVGHAGVGLPTTSDAVQPVYGGGAMDGFVGRLNSDNSGWSYLSYLGGSGNDAAYGVASSVDTQNGTGLSTTVTGFTESPNFPIYQPIQGGLAGTRDAFVTRLDYTGTQLRFSTYLGGSQADEGYVVKVDQAGAATIIGYSTSDDAPTVNPGQFVRAYGTMDGYVAHISPSRSPHASVPQRVTQYTYDGLDRLTRATEAPGIDYAYAYDRVGNRLEIRENGALVEHMQYNAADQVIGWQYDGAGNLLSDGWGTYQYDAFNRLIASTWGTQQSAYQYNGDGLPIARVDSSTFPGDSPFTTTLAYDLASPLPQLLQQIKPGHNPINYYYGQERLAASGFDTPREWYQADALGSLRYLTYDPGQPSSHWYRYNYTPIGGARDGLFDTFGFAGEAQDPTTGMTFNRARWYNTDHGVFMGRDPYPGDLEQPYSQHYYQYGLGNPVSYTDPTGLTTAPARPSRPGTTKCVPLYERYDSFLGRCVPNQGFPPPNNREQVPLRLPALNDSPPDNRSNLTTTLPDLTGGSRTGGRTGSGQLGGLLKGAALLLALGALCAPLIDNQPPRRQYDTLVSHYTSETIAATILASPGQLLMGTEGGYVFVFEGRSTPERARAAGAVQTEVRIVFLASRSELEIDPDVTRRMQNRNSPDTGSVIAEARRFWRPGPVSLTDRSPVIEVSEKPSWWRRFFGK